MGPRRKEGRKPHRPAQPALIRWVPYRTSAAGLSGPSPNLRLADLGLDVGGELSDVVRLLARHVMNRQAGVVQARINETVSRLPIWAVVRRVIELNGQNRLNRVGSA